MTIQEIKQEITKTEEQLDKATLQSSKKQLQIYLYKLKRQLGIEYARQEYLKQQNIVEND